ncbi:response regulator transcription factor [Nitriliruptoraceae bacterium ZYF776]|nr:response regulator transcription factor [Profundirhabdus halotolerans]
MMSRGPGGGPPTRGPQVVDTRTVIADGDPQARARTHASLHGRGFDIVAEVTDADAAVAATARFHPDLVLIDTALPGGATRAATEITVATPGTTVVMFGASADHEVLLASLRAGASGYLPRDTDPERLPIALWSAASGEAAIPRTLVRVLLEELQDRDRPRGLRDVSGRHVTLTNREWDVAELLREGLSTERIARQLFVAPVTVRTHVARVLHKLGVEDREHAVVLLRGESRSAAS